MTTFLYIGTEPREFPAEPGVTVFTQSFRVEPGETVDAAENPDPRWFDATDGSNPPAPPVITEGTTE